MATQTSATRQWFRLPTIARGPSPPPAPNTEPPAPQPRPPLFRAPFRPMPQPQPQPTLPQESTPAPPPPAYGVSSVPASPIRRTSVPSSTVPRTSPPTTTSPPKPQVSAPSPSLPASPSLKPPASPSKPPAPPMQTSPPKPEPAAMTTATHVPSPTPSPRTIKPADGTPPQSPYNKPTAPHPSPLILPPPQLKSKAELEPAIPAETEQKTVLVQTTSEKPKSWLNGTGNHKDFGERHNRSSHAHNGNLEVNKDVAKKEKGHHEKFSSDSDHEERMRRAITLAGENKGAFMEVIKSPVKHSFGGNSRTLHKTESDSSGWKSFSRSSSSSSDEWEPKKKDKNHKAMGATLSPPTGPFMNSNVQGVNNSIVVNSSCSHNDPGVHLSVSRIPSGNGFHVKDKSNGGHQSLD